jgi:hypothetical protein
LPELEPPLPPRLVGPPPEPVPEPGLPDEPPTGVELIGHGPCPPLCPAERPRSGWRPPTGESGFAGSVPGVFREPVAPFPVFRAASEARVI